MLTQDELRKKRWRKELRRKKVRKQGFQEGHQGYWTGKKRSEVDKEAMKEGHRKSEYVFTEEHKENLKIAKAKFWDRVKAKFSKVK